MSDMTFYIGTEKEYAVGAEVDESVFFQTLEHARARAQVRAEEVGMLFGNVYEISHEVDEDFARHPDKVIRHVEWSI